MLYVGRLEDSHAMWMALKHVHKEKGHQTAIAAQRALFRACAEEGDNIEEHLMKLKECVEHIQSLEVEDFMVNDTVQSYHLDLASFFLGQLCILNHVWDDGKGKLLSMQRSSWDLKNSLVS